jgi:hypothetical protein
MNFPRAAGVSTQKQAIAAAIAFCFATACSSDRHREPGVTFVHATDPHLFIPASQDPDKDKKAAGDRQESLNQKAFTDVLHSVQSVPDGLSAPAFLVLTGDLGADPCDITKPQPNQTPQTGQANPQVKTERTSKECVDSAKDSDKRKDQVQRAAQAFGSSVLKEIYLVAGNNDIANEDPDDVSLGYFNQFIDDVQKKLNENNTGVHLHNLTACYAASGGSSSCYADVPKTSYRLIGFPSYSFKNQGGKSSNNDEQARQFEMFRGLLDQTRQAGKQALILTHVPEIDDPYSLAQDRYAAKPPDPSNDKDPKNPRSAWSTWNVTTKLLNDWKSVLESDAVAGVLAGHLHDSHKEIYSEYNWSTGNDHRLGFRKLFLAPPIAVKNQDGSPIQARGFSLLILEPNHIGGLLFWYNPQTGEFKKDPHSQRHDKATGGWRWPNPIPWIWQLDTSDSKLIRLAILLIALLAAFLTIVAIWQIPPAENPLVAKKGGQDSASAPSQDAASPPVNTSPFASNFGKTVIAGLSGLAVTEIAKSLGGEKPSDGSKWFYVVWFILFFFVLLLLLSAIRAGAEALRAMTVIMRYPLARGPNRRSVEVQPAGGKQRAKVKSWHTFIDWFSYWWLRFLHWVFSLRVPLLTFFDTWINLIQGKNQTMTRYFAEEIIDKQRNVIRVVDTIRKDLTKLIEHELGPQETVTSPVRINISVLSADQSNVFYISRSAGSARLAFNKRSMAWVSVFTGEIFWYESSWKPADKGEGTTGDKGEDKTGDKVRGKLGALYDKTVLFDNSKGVIAGDEDKILLVSHYQPRHEDYEAFVVFPVPWPQRGFGSDYVKGAIHISFRREVDFEKLWKLHLPSGSPPVYPQGHHMLEDWCRHGDLRAALTNSIAILGELLRGFNEVIYKNYIEPNQCD